MFNLECLVRKNILELAPYSSARSEYTSSAEVYLDANENPFGELNRYPDPYQQKLKQRLSERNAVAIENIFIGNGSDEIIDLVLRVFCRPGIDKVLTFTPTYGMYKVAAVTNDVEMVECPLDNTFQLDKNTLSSALKEPDLKVVFLCSPNNPTANCLDAVATVLDSFNGIVFLDEAYIDFADQASFITYLSKYPQLIISQTLSKAWGLAAARIGIAYASAAIINYLAKTKPPYNVSALNQEAALAALADVTRYEKNIAIIRAEKSRVQLALKNMTIVTHVYPSDANFLLVETLDASKVYNGLLAQGIVVRNRQHVAKNCVRISIGTPQENEKLIQAMLVIQLSI